MKTCITGLLKRRITHWGILAAMLIVVGATVGWKDQEHSQRQYQLGGAFIGNNGAGSTWNALQIPLDPAGRTAAIRIRTTTYSADFAGLLAAFGADTLTEFTTQAEMISRDTAKYAAVGYGLKQANPPLICLIMVMRGTLEFTGPDSIVVNYTVDVYPGPANGLGLPNADVDADGYPDSGATPVYSIPLGPETGKRVPIP